MQDILTCEFMDGIAILTLNRPQARNALSKALRDELRRRIGELDADESVRVIILTGADPVFSAGIDKTELAADHPNYEPGIMRRPIELVATPLIGAINGAAYTGGLSIALACHFLIASEKATFADTHARMDAMPGWGTTVFLSEAIGARRARQMSLSSLPIDARTAYEWGLLNRVVPHEELLPTAIEIARAIMLNTYGVTERHVRLYNDQVTSRDTEVARLEREARIAHDLAASSSDETK